MIFRRMEANGKMIGAMDRDWVEKRKGMVESFGKLPKKKHSPWTHACLAVFGFAACGAAGLGMGIGSMFVASLVWMLGLELLAASNWIGKWGWASWRSAIRAEALSAAARSERSNAVVLGLMMAGSAFSALRLQTLAARFEALALARLDRLKANLKEGSKKSWKLLASLDREAAKESCLARAFALALAWEGSEASAGWSAVVRRGDGPWSAALSERTEHLARLAWRWDWLGEGADWRPRNRAGESSALKSFAEAFDQACQVCSLDLSLRSESSEIAASARERYLAEHERSQISQELCAHADGAQRPNGASRRL